MRIGRAGADEEAVAVEEVDVVRAGGDEDEVVFGGVEGSGKAFGDWRKGSVSG